MSRPARVLCSSCRTEVSSADAREVMLLLTAHRGGSLGSVDHVTRTGIWLCRRPCATANPFDLAALTRLREHFSRAPANEQRSLLA